MTKLELCLDLPRLEKMRHVGTKIIARCPACAEVGGDRRGNHLAILPSGKFACAAMPGDAEHRRRIFALAGIVGEWKRDPEQDRMWRDNRARERQEYRAKERLIATAKAKRAAIIARHEWAPASVWEDSPQRIDCPLVEFGPRHFLDSLFPAGAVLWTGKTHESGQEGRYANRWRTCREWSNAPVRERIGPMVTPAIWKDGAVSRIASNILARPYVVLDFDGFDGVKPETPEELHAHIHASLALVHWLHAVMGWQLAAILWTGNKSLHAWFHSAHDDVIQSLKSVSPGLGIDAGLIGRPEHPCRLPGHPHDKSGQLSRVLWLQAPNA